jgi:hypothetical protein
MRTRAATDVGGATSLLALTACTQASVSLSVTTTTLPHVIRVHVQAHTQPGAHVSTTARYHATVVTRTLIANANGHAETFDDVPRGSAGSTFEVSASVRVNRGGASSSASSATSITLSG